MGENSVSKLHSLESALVACTLALGIKAEHRRVCGASHCGLLPLLEDGLSPQHALHRHRSGVQVHRQLLRLRRATTGQAHRENTHPLAHREQCVRKKSTVEIRDELLVKKKK